MVYPYYRTSKINEGRTLCPFMERDPQHIINLVTRYRNMMNNIQQILIVAISLETGRLVGTSINLNKFYHRGLVTKLCPTPVTPWAVACQILCSRNFPDKNTRLGCHFLLQGIFLTQRLEAHPLHCRQILFTREPSGKPMKTGGLVGTSINFSNFTIV